MYPDYIIMELYPSLSGDSEYSHHIRESHRAQEQSPKMRWIFYPFLQCLYHQSSDIIWNYYRRDYPSDSLSETTLRSFLDSDSRYNRDDYGNSIPKNVSQAYDGP